MDRRNFVKNTLVTSASLTLGNSVMALNSSLAPAKKPVLRLAVKYSMIKAGTTPLEKLTLAKKLGIEGVEVDSPSGLNKEEAKKEPLPLTLAP
jgi:hypothetical protein